MKKKLLVLFLIFPFLLGMLQTANSQSAVLSNMVWADEAPKQVPDNLVALGDDGYLYINATLYAKDIVQPRIEITLPAGVIFATNSGTASQQKIDVVQNSPELTYGSFGNPTMSVGSATAGYQKLVIYYTANSSTLHIGDSVVMKFNIRANCGVNVFNPGDIVINFYAGNGDFILGGYKYFQVSVQKPTLRIFPTPGYEIINYTHVKDTNLVSIKFDAQNGYVNSTYLTLAYNGTIIYLDSFKINGVDLPLLATNAGIGVYHTGTTSRTTYIRLDQSVLGRKIDDVAHTLTFRATSNLGCNRMINTTIRNNLATSCETWTGSQIILQLPSTGVAPSFSLASQLRFDPDIDATDPKANNWYYVCYDGVTPYYKLITFKNTNSAPTSAFQFSNYWYLDAHTHQYLDTSKVYFRVTVPSIIDGTDSIVVPLTKIPGNLISYGTAYPRTTAQFAPPLGGTAADMTFKLPIDVNDPLPPDATIKVLQTCYANPEWNLDSYRSRSNYTASGAVQSGGNNGLHNYNYTYNRDIDVTTATSSCGETWSTTTDIYSTIMYKPNFLAPGAQQITVYPNRPITISNAFHTGDCNTTATNTPTLDPTGERYTEVFIKLPSWCGLDTTAAGITSAFDISGQAPEAGSGTYDPVNNIYSVRYYTNSTSITTFLNIKLLPKECTESCVIVSDTMQIWADWVPGTPEGGCHARFRKVTKIWSQLLLNCQPPAIVIEDWGVYRETRGLRDSNNNHFPDDGTPALDSEIQHWHFAQRDTGYYYIKGYIGGTSTDIWDHLQAVLSYRTGGTIIANYQYKWGTTGHTTPFWNNATITIKKAFDGSTAIYPLNIPVVTNQDSLIVNYNGITNDYQPAGGDSVYIKIPFVVTNGQTSSSSNDMDLRGSIDVKTYGEQASNPECNGYYSVEPFKVSFKGLNTHNRNTATPLIYDFLSPCSAHTIGKNPASYPANYPDHPTDYPNYISRGTIEVYAVTYPHFGADLEVWTYEVRNLHKITSVSFTVPAGYYRTKNTVDFGVMRWMDRNWSPSSQPLVPTSATENFTTHDSTFVFDMSQIYDYSYDGSDPTKTISTTGEILLNGVPTGKYPIGDDGAGASFVLPLMATPGIFASNPNITGTFTFENEYGTKTVQNSTVNSLVYAGPRLYLETSPAIIYTNSQQLSMSSVKIQNSHGTYTDQNVWLYLKGKVRDTYLVLNTDTIWGTGLNNCWIPVGNLTPLQLKTYRLNFEYLGKDECVNDTIVLYTAFDSEFEGWNPDITKSIDSVPVCKRGTYQYTILDVVAPKTKVAGHITTYIPNPAKPGALHHVDGYTVNYYLDGRVSQGALNNPSVTVRIPYGQVYTDTTTMFGIATFEYPVGSGFRPIPQALRDSLKKYIGEDSDDSQIREFTIYATDLLEDDPFMLPGWGADATFGFTDLDRVINICLPMVPTCETDLTGIRFRGTFYGFASCGEQCEDYGMQYITPTIYTDVYPEYSFQVNLNNIHIDSRTFTPDKMLDTLVATFKKDLGVFTKLIKVGDYVLLRMPGSLQLNGPITSPTYGVIPVLHDSISPDGERIYTLFFPVVALNDSLPFRMDSIAFTYHIPVKYTPDPTNDCSAPKQEIVCQVVTNANFKEGVCEDRPLSLGSGTVLIIAVNFDKMRFYACLNMATPLTIACGGVTPVWFRDAAGTGGQLIAANTFVYTPTVQRDTTFYIRAIYDYGGDEEEDFGLAPIGVTMYPEVKADFSADTVCLGSPTLFVNSSTIGGVTSTTTNTTSWEWFLGSATTPFSTDRTPSETFTVGTHSIKLKVTSKDGCVHEKTKNIYVRPKTVPTISGTLDTCYTVCVVYKTEVSMTNYNWTVENGTVVGPVNMDSVRVCWNLAYSPTRGHVKVTYTDTHGCASEMTDKEITVRQTPAIAVITGDDDLCVNSEETYHFETQPGIVIGTYIWRVTGGTVVAGGGTTNSFVTVNWTDVGIHEISLFVANPSCSAPDTGRLHVDVHGPVRPTITGTDSLCMDLTGVDKVYTTNSGMDNYNWYIENGTVISGGTTNVATVHWDTYGIGKVAVSYSKDGCTTFSLDTLKVKLLPCDVIDCTPMINRTVSEDTCYAGLYTHSGTDWDAVLLTGVPLDSAQYFVNGTIVSHGATATLHGVQFIANTTSAVECVVFSFGVNDTCRFNVRVDTIPNAIASQIIIKNDTICMGTTSTLTPTTAILSPVFRWYESQTDPVPFYEGPFYTTSALAADTTLYISVSGTGYCENIPGTRKAVSVKVNDYALAPDITILNDSICPSTKATLTPTTGITNPTFRWYVSQTATTPFYTGGSYTTSTLLADSTFYIGVFGDNFCENKINTRKSVKAVIKVCDLIDCDPSPRTVTEDGCGVGYYSKMDASWNITPLPGIVFDSVRYIVNSITRSSGITATLSGVIFTTGMPQLVECIAYLGAITDTCKFLVTVNAIPFAGPADINTNNAVICSGTSASLIATSNTIATPVFRWYDSQSATATLLWTGANYITNPLSADTAFYVTICNATTCEIKPGDRVKVTVTVVSMPVAPDILIDTLPAFRWMPVDLSTAVDINPAYTYTYYENPDGTGRLSGSIVIFNPPKDDYYVTATNDFCEGPMSKIILKDPCPTSVDDNEGNTYKVTSLGGYCWTENLKSTLYADNVPIPFAEPYTCPTCPAQLDTIFGLLYDWYSAVRVSRATFVQGICPNGWHVPSQAEWSALNPFPAQNLKSSTYWLNPPGAGTDDYGWDARPAGWYNSALNRFEDLYGYAGWWASDDLPGGNGTTASSFYLSYYCSKVEKEIISKMDGLSVRCVLNY